MSTMTEDQTYNGWKNYPTWNVNLWLSNDEGLYRATLDSIAGAREYFEDSVEKESGREFRGFLADWLRDWINDDLLTEGLAPQAASYSPASMVDDLTQWALGQVDWYEIADAWLEED
jgi:hypothetical protein